MMPTPSADGPASVCPPRPNGRGPPGEPTAGRIPGERKLRLVNMPSWRTAARPAERTAWFRFAQNPRMATAHMACVTAPEMRGSGFMTFMTRTISRRVHSRIPWDRKPAARGLKRVAASSAATHLHQLRASRRGGYDPADAFRDLGFRCVEANRSWKSVTAAITISTAIDDDCCQPDCRNRSSAGGSACGVSCGTCTGGRACSILGVCECVPAMIFPGSLQSSIEAIGHRPASTGCRCLRASSRFSFANTVSIRP